jgi:AAA+ ATPase superfamily predicted ATPase
MANYKFYNRVRERQSLKDSILSSRSELIILYGRRGVGKSALLRQVLEDSSNPYLFYRAVRRTLPLQLDALTNAFRSVFPNVYLPQTFASTNVFLDSISYEAQRREQNGDSQPVCVVIDELPYLADVDAGFLTALQHWWDDNKRQPNIKLFLAGSWLSFMERQVLDERAPLYNRRTGAMRLEPLDYAEAGLFFPNYTPEEKLEAYAILGGMPSYLEQFDAEKNLQENLLATVFRSNTYLSQEPDWLLLEDLRRDVTYGSILRAIACGERKPSDIARAIGKSSAQEISVHLSTLQDLALVVREVPITEKGQLRSRNSLYYISDHYLNFWYRFVDPARSLISQGLGNELWTKDIETKLGEFVSKPAFEWVARDYLWRALRVGILPEECRFVDVGTWWGGGDIEIDVMAINVERQPVIVGSCKWTSSAMGLAELDALRRDVIRAGLDVSGLHYALFSRSGFNQPLKDYVAQNPSQPVLLVDLEQLYAVS